MNEAMENNVRDEEEFSFMQTWIQGLVAGKAKKVGWCRGGQTGCVGGKKKSKAVPPHSKILLFLIFRAGPSFLFLYSTVQDTCVPLMLINISVGPGLSKPWVFGMLTKKGLCEQCSGVDTLGGALQPRQKEPPLTRQSLLRSAAAAVKSLQSCPTLCDPIDSSLLGTSIPGILQARTLEWVGLPSPKSEVSHFPTQ